VKAICLSNPWLDCSGLIDKVMASDQQQTSRPSPPSTPSAPAESARISLSGDVQASVLTIAGRLDSGSFLQAWEQSVEPCRRNVPRKLLVDVSAMDYCDGAGLGLLSELRRIVASSHGKFELAGVREEHRRLLAMSELTDPDAALRRPAREGIILTLGRFAAEVMGDIRQIITFIGELLATLVWMARHPRRLRLGDMLATAEKAGANATGVVCLLGFLVGLILAFQTAGPLAVYGVQPMIPTIVSIAVVREMGPLITAIILAGRSGSAFAAEIGTMKVTEELNALKTLGLEPVQFLVVPRVLAALIVTPVLTAFNILMSIIGAYIVMAALGYSLSFYINQVMGAVGLGDFISGIFKGLIFGLIVAGIGCLRGMQTRSGPGAVGDSTTRAVVSGIVLTIVADAVLGVLFYYLHI